MCCILFIFHLSLLRWKTMSFVTVFFAKCFCTSKHYAKCLLTKLCRRSDCIYQFHRKSIFGTCYLIFSSKIYFASCFSHSQWVAFILCVCVCVSLLFVHSLEVFAIHANNPATYSYWISWWKALNFSYVTFTPFLSGKAHFLWTSNRYLLSFQVCIQSHPNERVWHNEPQHQKRRIYRIIGGMNGKVGAIGLVANISIKFCLLFYELDDAFFFFFHFFYFRHPLL